VKLSAFSIVDEFPASEGVGRNRYDEVVQLAEVAEAAGLAGLWVAEHHFQPGGVCPSPPVLLGACAARTQRLRLGAMVTVLPFHRPVDVAEQYALLDQLTHGRLNLGVGSGYIPAEFEGFGVDPTQKRALFDAALDDILGAFGGRPLLVSPTAPHAVSLNVRPVQTPHPPVWVAVQRREALPFVARRGLSVALIPYATVSSLSELSTQVREFRAALLPGGQAEVAVALHVYAGDHLDRARGALDRYLASRLRTQSAFYEAKAAREPRHAGREGLEEGGFALLGSAKEVARRLEPYREMGVDEVLGIFDFGGLPAEDVAASVANLGRAFQP
jgi:alkanesulfonate monooxygenase SsuD/methylene tetrahydromethanopterin reductase-like flavin-dependent oxidoreductase (luciferase family)